jgi:hypothetical protein
MCVNGSNKLPGIRIRVIADPEFAGKHEGKITDSYQVLVTNHEIMMVNQLDSSIHLVIVAYRARCMNVLRLSLRHEEKLKQPKKK